MDISKVPPNDINSEKAVLGCLMIPGEQKTIAQIFNILKADDFYFELHRTIYNTIIDLYVKNIEADTININSRLQNNEQFKDHGGFSYLTELTDIVSSAANAEHYAEEVLRLSHTRMLLNACHEFKGKLLKNSDNPLVLTSNIQSRLFEILKRNNSNGIVHIADTVRPTLNEINDIITGQAKSLSIKTGFKLLDEMTGGFFNSDFIVLAARPSMGKTMLGLNIGLNIAKNEKKAVLMFSLEMSVKKLNYRFFSNMGNVEGWRIRKPSKGSLYGEYSKLHTAARELSELPIYIDDTPGLTVLEMQMRAKKWAMEMKSKNVAIGLVMIDHIQKIKGSDIASKRNREQEVAEFSQGLCTIAKDLNVPVLALSQLSRKNESRENKKPMLSDLRDSGTLEQDADTVIFLHRDGYYKKDDPELKNSATLIIEKQRDGDTGEIGLVFNFKFCRFEDLNVGGD
ncbi:MAG: replicative DNA helicase [Endomicrobium sp.]|jgi:replicative DNA helicase|nr:replicative DNA helicase [Endomicrobium sp.]